MVWLGLRALRHKPLGTEGGIVPDILSGGEGKGSLCSTTIQAHALALEFSATSALCIFPKPICAGKRVTSCV